MRSLGGDNPVDSLKTQAFNRAQILNVAKKYVTQDRQATHGKPEDSFSRIAEFWSTYLQRPITSKDVSVMMALLKVARLDENPQNSDNWIDACGYLACGGEIAINNEFKEKVEEEKPTKDQRHEAYLKQTGCENGTCDF